MRKRQYTFPLSCLFIGVVFGFFLTCSESKACQGRPNTETAGPQLVDGSCSSSAVQKALQDLCEKVKTDAIAACTANPKCMGNKGINPECTEMESCNLAEPTECTGPPSGQGTSTCLPFTTLNEGTPVQKSLIHCTFTATPTCEEESEDHQVECGDGFWDRNCPENKEIEEQCDPSALQPIDLQCGITTPSCSSASGTDRCRCVACKCVLRGTSKEASFNTEIERVN